MRTVFGLADARAFKDGFTHAYNPEHRLHSGISLHTRADVHYGHARAVSTDPKILALPESPSINRPEAPAEQAVA